MAPGEVPSVAKVSRHVPTQVRTSLHDAHTSTTRCQARSDDAARSTRAHHDHVVIRQRPSLEEASGIRLARTSTALPPNEQA
jgi:hypothetical protein